MFVYEAKELYNEAGEGPFSGMVVKPGTDFIPAVAGETVLAVIENEGVLELLEEFVVGEKPVEQEGPYFYSHEVDSEQFDKMNTPYSLSEADWVGGDSGYWDILTDPQEGGNNLVCVEYDTQVTCRSNSGYDLPADLQPVWVGGEQSTEYKGVRVTEPTQFPDDFYDKTVEYDGKDIPAVDITISTGGAIFTCTIAALPLI